METRSQQIFYDFVMKEKLQLSHIEKIKEIIRKNFTVVKEDSYNFSEHGEGQTIVFILSESHFTLHTYPEHDYLSMDIYICNQSVDLNKTIDEIKENIPVLIDNKEYQKRGHINYYRKEINPKFIYFITFVVAFCSILYEFLMAQTLSLLTGNTILRYNISIGLFIASMGIGAIFCHHFLKYRNDIYNFIKIEILLAITGFLSPIICLVSSSFFNEYLFYIISHFLIIAIGAISGFEIPLLINILKKYSEQAIGKVLFFDYLGCVLSALFFHFIFAYHFSIFQIGAISSVINLSAGILCLFYFKAMSKKQLLISCFIILVGLSFIFFNLDNYLIQEFYVKQ